jgi:hypothetical protein
VSAEADRQRLLLTTASGGAIPNLTLFQLRCLLPLVAALDRDVSAAGRPGSFCLWGVKSRENCDLTARHLRAALRGGSHLSSGPQS